MFEVFFEVHNSFLIIIFFFPGTILDHLVGEDVIADYLLYSLNRLGNFRWELSASVMTVWTLIQSVCLLRHITVTENCVCAFMCSYVEKYSLQEPCDDIKDVLKRIAVKLGKTQRVKAITGVGKKKLILHILHILLHTVSFTSH